MKPIQLIQKAIEFAVGAYENYEEEQYRQSVLDGIGRLEAGLSDLKKAIEEDIAQLSNQLQFVELWSSIDNPLNRIQTAYDLLDADNLPDDTAKISDDISKAMMQLHEAICGQSGQYDHALALYIRTLTTSQPTTSKLEKSYLYFTQVLINGMVKGLAFLGACEKGNDFLRWQQLLTKGDPSASKEYLRQPFLEYEAAQCQTIIDGQTDDIDFAWVGCTDATLDTFKLVRMFINGYTEIPDDHVLVGWDKVTDNQHVVLTVLWHGKLGDDGYVTDIQMSYQGGEPVDIFASYPDVAEGSTRWFIDLNSVQAPEGHVVIGIKWQRDSTRAYYPQGSIGNETYGVFLTYLSILHAPYIPGTGIDVANSAWLTPESRINEITPIWKFSADTAPFNVPSGIYPIEGPWSGLCYSIKDEWNTPIRAVRQWKGKAAFLADYHRKQFALDMSN